MADPGGREIYGVGLQPTDSLDRGFESLCCGLCYGPITRSEESYCVCECV